MVQSAKRALHHIPDLRATCVLKVSCARMVDVSSVVPWAFSRRGKLFVHLVHATKKDQLVQDVLIWAFARVSLVLVEQSAGVFFNSVC